MYILRNWEWLCLIGALACLTQVALDPRTANFFMLAGMAFIAPPASLVIGFLVLVIGPMLMPPGFGSPDRMRFGIYARIVAWAAYVIFAAAPIGMSPTANTLQEIYALRMNEIMGTAWSNQPLVLAVYSIYGIAIFVIPFYLFRWTRQERIAAGAS